MTRVIKPLTIRRDRMGGWLWWCECMHSGRRWTWGQAVAEALAHCRAAS
jgi:hypothetical protein